MKALIFDLDNTLFNTGFLVQAAGKQGVVMKRGVGGFDTALVKKINWQAINSQGLVFDQVFEILTSFQKKGYNLFLFSDGDREGQLFKLEFSGLDKFFSSEKRYIFEKDKEKEISQILEKIPSNAEIWYFDDKQYKLESVKRTNGKIKTVLVCQGPWWQTEIPGFEPDYKIKEFKEARKII